MAEKSLEHARHSKSNCNVLCYCRENTPSRNPRAAKLAWTPSRLLLLHFNNNKPAERFDDIIAKLQEKKKKEEEELNTLTVPEDEERRRLSQTGNGGRRRSSQNNKKKAVRPVPNGLYEHQPVIIHFSQPRVRSRLERLMGTNVVRITDRNYMQKLQVRIREDHEENVRKRIHDREIGEVDREKHLILEGKMPVEEAPEELANHPVFKITQMTNKILEEKRQKAEVESMSKLMKKLKNYELSLPDKKEEVEETEVEKCIELDEVEVARALKLQQIEENISAGALFTQEDYDRIKYEDPMIKQLRTLETVDELYKLADQIVGSVYMKKR